MRVKIGEIWYDGTDQPLMVEFSGNDKKSIADNFELKKFCQFPDIGYSKEYI